MVNSAEQSLILTVAKGVLTTLQAPAVKSQFIWNTPNPVPIHTAFTHTLTFSFTKPLSIFSMVNNRGAVVGVRGSLLYGKCCLVSGGQPKGKILLQESDRGERGWNHVRFIFPGEETSINSFNPVFLQIRLANFGRESGPALCCRGVQRGLMGNGGESKQWSHP